MNITIDTLTDGRAWVPVEKPDSSFYNRSLFLSEPYDIFTGHVAEPEEVTENENEYLIQNIDIPNDFGGCFPKDATYNSGNNH